MEPAPLIMKGRPMVLVTVLVLIGLPVVLAAAEAVSYYVRNRNNGAIVSSGQAREYLLHVPRSYDPTRPTPLVISLHGAGLWPAAQMEISRWNTVAESEGFIVVYPSGLADGAPPIWRATAPAGDGLTRDVRFISDLIDALQAAYNIDLARIYVNGLSNGGGMSFALSCTLSDRIAAVGMVSAAQLLPWSWCPDTRPVPMIAFHGTADRETPYHGGASWVSRRPFPDIPAFTVQWAGRNRCAPNPVESAVAADVTRVAYTHCADAADVVLYRIEGGGHAWPGGMPVPEWLFGVTSKGIDATGQMWAFFRAHPRPGRARSRKRSGNRTRFATLPRRQRR